MQIKTQKKKIKKRANITKAEKPLKDTCKRRIKQKKRKIIQRINTKVKSSTQTRTNMISKAQIDQVI